MELILWRHADAEYIAPSDLQRPLSSKGQKQAGKMARWLRDHLDGRPVRVISSAAYRARETAAALGEKIEVLPSLNPGADLQDYLRASGWPGQDNEVVILVGHQMEIGCVAQYLLYGNEVSCEFKKGAIWWIRQRQGEAQASLRVMMTPEMA